MGLAIALSLIVAVTVLAFYLGRKQGRAEVAAHTIRELTPLLPLLDELLVHAEELQGLVGVEQSEALGRFNESAGLN